MRFLLVALLFAISYAQTARRNLEGEIVAVSGDDDCYVYEYSAGEKCGGGVERYNEDTVLGCAERANTAGATYWSYRANKKKCEIPKGDSHDQCRVDMVSNGAWTIYMIGCVFADPTMDPAEFTDPTMSPLFFEDPTMSPLFFEDPTMSPLFFEDPTMSPVFFEDPTMSPVFFLDPTMDPASEPPAIGTGPCIVDLPYSAYHSGYGHDICCKKPAEGDGSCDDIFGYCWHVVNGADRVGQTCTDYVPPTFTVSMVSRTDGVDDTNKDAICDALSVSIAGTTSHCSRKGPSHSYDSDRRRLEEGVLFTDIDVAAESTKTNADSALADGTFLNGVSLPGGVSLVSAAMVYVGGDCSVVPLAYSTRCDEGSSVRGGNGSPEACAQEAFAIGQTHFNFREDKNKCEMPDQGVDGEAACVTSGVSTKQDWTVYAIVCPPPTVSPTAEPTMEPTPIPPPGYKQCFSDFSVSDCDGEPDDTSVYDYRDAYCIAMGTDYATPTQDCSDSNCDTCTDLVDQNGGNDGLWDMDVCYACSSGAPACFFMMVECPVDYPLEIKRMEKIFDDNRGRVSDESQRFMAVGKRVKKVLRHNRLEELDDMGRVQPVFAKWIWRAMQSIVRDDGFSTKNWNALRRKFENLKDWYATNKADRRRRRL